MVNRSFIENSNKNIANLLLKAFPNMEVFPSIGNHDVFPVDNAKPGKTLNLKQLIYITLFGHIKSVFGPCKWNFCNVIHTQRQVFSIRILFFLTCIISGPYWLYTDLAVLWKHWLNSESLKTFLKGMKFRPRSGNKNYFSPNLTILYYRRIL
jgi:ABC-type uncharacterized transport system fused permease/ATPase subunit